MEIFNSSQAAHAVEHEVLLEGPWSVGKSTLLQAIARRTNGHIFDLDDVATLEAVATDPAIMVEGPGPVCVDEYRRAPIVLDAIKAELNRSSRPGQFVLTGSARHQSLPTAVQALTGRLHRMSVLPFAQSEIECVNASLLSRIFDGGAADTIGGRPSPMTRGDYVERIVRGGFPLALSRASATARHRWFDDYLHLTPDKLTRRDPTSLTELGHLVETFVVGELLKEVSWMDGIASVGHWRTYDGDEVDLVVERDDGAVVAFEIKGAGRVPGDDLRGLRKLRDAVGEAFLAGVPLYTGERGYTFEDRLRILSIDRLWTTP